LSIVDLEGERADCKTECGIAVIDGLRGSERRADPRVAACKRVEKRQVCRLSPVRCGAGYWMRTLLLVVPRIPLLATVLPADCVPAQLARLAATDTRAAWANGGWHLYDS
jgi:hypothetical protein